MHIIYIQFFLDLFSNTAKKKILNEKQDLSNMLIELTRHVCSPR